MKLPEQTAIKTNISKSNCATHNLPAGRQVEKAHIANNENQGVENSIFYKSCVY